MKRLYFLKIVFVLLTIGTRAQVATGYNDYKWIDANSGLSQLAINNFAIDNNRFVWIVSTKLGMYRFDGQKVVAFHSSNYPEINKNRISHFYKNPKTGEIFFQTFPDLKNYIIEESTIRKIKNSEGVFVNKGLFLKATDPFYKVFIKYLKTAKEEFTSVQIHNASSNNTFIYLFYKDHLVCLDRNGRKSIITSPGIANNYTCKFGESILLIGKKVGLLTNTKITYGTIKTGKMMSEVLKNTIIPGRDYGISVQGQDYYLSYKDKLYKIRFQNNYLDTQYVMNIPANSIKKFYYDKKNDLYFFGIVNQGIVIVNPKKFNTINTVNKYKFVDYNAVQKGKKWYNFNGWIYDYKDRSLQSRTINNYFGNQRFLLEYKGDYFYQATNQSLISIIDLKTNLPFKLHKKLEFLTSFTYLNKKLWLANEKYIGLQDDKKIILDTLVTQHLKISQHINTINSLQGNLLIGTTKGVFLHKPFSSNFDYIKGLEHVNARYFKFLDQNNFWVGCYGEGLFLVHNEKVYPVNNTVGDIKTAHAIEEDTAGNLWISTNDGLLTVNKKTALQSILNHQPIDTYAFTIEDGLPTNEFNGGSTHPSLKTQEGIIGFPSMNGFVYFNPQQVKKHVFSSAIIIDDIVSDDAKRAPFKNGGYTVDAEAEILKINFSYAYHFNRENISISYKFDDQEKWTNITGTNIILPRYQKGSHKLHIKIKTHGFEDKNDVIKVVTLDFKPKYHETVWFWTLILVLILLLLMLMFQIGTAIQKKRAVELRDKIDEKTAQLSQNITRLQISNEQLETSKLQLSQALSEREMLLREIHHRVKNNLQIIMSLLKIQANEGSSKSIEDFLEISESRIQSMALIHQSLYENGNLGNIIYQDYLEQLVHHLQSAMGQQNDSITFKIEAENIFLEIETAISLGLIINELVTNTLKYAFPNYEAGNVLISIQQLAENEFQMIYSDSGTGYEETNQTVPSFGLELVRMLVKELKGTLVKVAFSGTKYCISFRQINGKPHKR